MNQLTTTKHTAHTDDLKVTGRAVTDKLCKLTFRNEDYDVVQTWLTAKEISEVIAVLTAVQAEMV
tara:strand:+ start:76 stop:270 length:195 start_codon:yes stop_codon:yes gene_type:complete